MEGKERTLKKNNKRVEGKKHSRAFDKTRDAVSFRSWLPLVALPDKVVCNVEIGKGVRGKAEGRQSTSEEMDSSCLLVSKSIAGSKELRGSGLVAWHNNPAILELAQSQAGRAGQGLQGAFMLSTYLLQWMFACFRGWLVYQNVSIVLSL